VKAATLVLLGALSLCAQHMKNFQIPKHVPPGSTVVIGFLGGFEHWNDPHRGVRKVALDLRESVPGIGEARQFYTPRGTSRNSAGMWN
jgi:hypothetical protein